MMVRPVLPRCLSHATSHSRRLHTQTSIASLLDQGGEESRNVIVNGFIRSIRNQKRHSFAAIGDGSSLQPLQALLTPDQAKSLTNGTAVRLTGSWRPSPNPKAQSHELHVSGIDIIGSADPATYPLQKKYQTNDYLRTMPHLRSRLPFNSTLLRFRSDAIAAVNMALSSQEFTQTHTPIMTSSDCEGAGEVFEVRTQKEDEKKNDLFFRSNKYLTVSSQLHLEALAQSVGNVWTLSPTFRAERSDTARHLAEFYMLEAEIPFVEDMNEVMDVVQTIVKAIGDSLMSSRVGKELLQISSTPYGEDGLDEKELQRRWNGTRHAFHRITYTSAIEMLQSSTHQFEHEPKWGLGLQAEHERYIATELGGNDDCVIPVFVTQYPKAIKPFYMLPTVGTEAGRETVDCFDLLVPEACEIAGGSMREHRLGPLIKSMQSNHLIPQGDISSDTDLGSLGWYVDLRRWSSIPHGGFGLGFDRLLGYLAGVPNIREMVTFPRWVKRCDC